MVMGNDIQARSTNEIKFNKTKSQNTHTDRLCNVP